MTYKLEKMFEKRTTWRNLTVRILPSLLLGVFLTLHAPPVVAQAPPDDEPSRTGTLTAPERGPVLLSTKSLSPAVTQSTIVFAPVADTYLASGRPNQTFGGADGLFLGYNLDTLDFGAERILLRFNLTGAIPENVTIIEAYLELYLSASYPENDAPMGTVLRRLASPWDENEVTWNSEPTWGGIRASPSVGSSPGRYKWDITGLVADWLKGVFPNYGLEIIGDEHVQLRERVFYARETATDFYPRLVVTYVEGSSDDQPPVVSVDPLPAYVDRDFTVSWSGSDQGSAGIAYYDVQYRINEGDWVTWLSEVTFTSHEYTGAENGQFFQFRARGVDNAGNAEAFGTAEAETRVDVVPPEARVLALPFIVSAPSFTVSWTGNDNPAGAGILCYDVQYRFNNGPWTSLQNCTTDTSIAFASLGDGNYAFEARAIDNAGNLEPFENRAEALTIVDTAPPFVEVKEVYLPAVLDNSAE